MQVHTQGTFVKVLRRLFEKNILAQSVGGETTVVLYQKKRQLNQCVKSKKFLQNTSLKRFQYAE